LVACSSLSFFYTHLFLRLSKALIGFVDEDRLLHETRVLESSLTPEEARRNAVDSDKLFLKKGHPSLQPFDPKSKKPVVFTFSASNIAGNRTLVYLYFVKCNLKQIGQGKSIKDRTGKYLEKTNIVMLDFELH